MNGLTTNCKGHSSVLLWEGDGNRHFQHLIARNPQHSSHQFNIFLSCCSYMQDPKSHLDLLNVIIHAMTPGHVLYTIHFNSLDFDPSRLFTQRE